MLGSRKTTGAISMPAIEPIAAAMSLREALSVFVARGSDCLPVVDERGEALGVLHFNDLIAGQALS